MQKNKTRFIATASVIAALYVLLTLLAKLLGLADMAVQIRFSEALTILPAFIASAIPGVALGCLLSNLLMGAHIFDTVFGSLTTLLAAILTRLLKNRHPVLQVLPPILLNAAIVPLILIYAYGLGDFTLYPYFFLTVGSGQILSAGVLGLILSAALKKQKNLFPE